MLSVLYILKLIWSNFAVPEPKKEIVFMKNNCIPQTTTTVSYFSPKHIFKIIDVLAK